MPDPLWSRSDMRSNRELVNKALKGRHVNNPGREPRDKRNKSDVLAGFLTRRASKIVTKPRDNITR